VKRRRNSWAKGQRGGSRPRAKVGKSRRRSALRSLSVRRRFLRKKMRAWLSKSLVFSFLIISLFARGVAPVERSQRLGPFSLFFFPTQSGRQREGSPLRLARRSRSLPGGGEGVFGDQETVSSPGEWAAAADENETRSRLVSRPLVHALCCLHVATWAATTFVQAHKEATQRFPELSLLCLSVFFGRGMLLAFTFFPSLVSRNKSLKRKQLSFPFV
jgi:hypothetical protein